MAGEIIFYQSEDGTIRLETRLEKETLWLTQQQMAELFHTSVPNISMHIKNVVEEGELQSEATVQDFLTVRQEGGAPGAARTDALQPRHGYFSRLPGEKPHRYTFSYLGNASA